MAWHATRTACNFLRHLDTVVDKCGTLSFVCLVFVTQPLFRGLVKAVSNREMAKPGEIVRSGYGSSAYKPGRYTAANGWHSTDFFALEVRCGEDGTRMHDPERPKSCLSCNAHQTERDYWKPMREKGMDTIKRLRGLSENVCPTEAHQVVRAEQVPKFLRDLAFAMAGDADLRKTVSYGGAVWRDRTQIEAAVLGGRLEEYGVQKKLLKLRRKDGPDEMLSFVRVAYDRGNKMYAQWARKNVGEQMAGTPKDEKAGDYAEAMLGLTWFEEEMETFIGWGNMHLVHTELASQLLALHIEALEACFSA